MKKYFIVAFLLFLILIPVDSPRWIKITVAICIAYIPMFSFLLSRPRREEERKEQILVERVYIVSLHFEESKNVEGLKRIPEIRSFLEHIPGLQLLDHDKRGVFEVACNQVTIENLDEELRKRFSFIEYAEPKPIKGLLIPNVIKQEEIEKILMK